MVSYGGRGRLGQFLIQIKDLKIRPGSHPEFARQVWP